MGSRVHAARVTELHMKATRPAQQKLFFATHMSASNGSGGAKEPPPSYACLAESNHKTIKCKRGNVMQVWCSCRHCMVYCEADAGLVT